MKALTQDSLKASLHYDPTTGEFTRRVAPGVSRKSKVGSVNNRGYLRIYVAGKLYSAHRLAWLYVYGTFPENHIDHVNRERTDNRICNLRDVTPVVNTRNLENPVPGVTQLTGHWVASISAFGVQATLYYGMDFFEAVCARKTAELIVDAMATPLEVREWQEREYPKRITHAQAFAAAVREHRAAL